MGMRSQFQGNDMFVRDVEIVKGQHNRIVPSLVWLDLKNNEIKQVPTSGVYLDTMKGRFNFLSFLSNREFGFRRDFVGSNLRMVLYHAMSNALRRL